MTQTESKTIWQKILKIDYRIIYAIYLGVIAIFVITPIGLPIPITEQTRNAFDFAVNELQAGDVVVYDTQWGRGSLSTEPGGRVVAAHLLGKGVKLICVGTLSSANPYAMDSLELYVNEHIAKGNLPEGLAYGKDWVYIAPLGLSLIHI